MTVNAWLAVAGLIFVHALIDIALPYHLFDEWSIPAGVLRGVCISQFNLIALWAAFAPGSVVVRIPWSGFLAVLMWLALVAGNRLAVRFGDYYGYTFSREEATQLGVILLIGVVGVVIPTWIVSRAFRWRLMPPLAATDEKSDRHFSIGQLMIGTALVAVGFGLGRLILPEGEARLTAIPSEAIFGLVVAGCVNLLVVLPCIWVLRVSWPKLGLCCIAWFGLLVIISLLEIAVLAAAFGPPPDDVYGQFFCINLAQCVGVAASMLVLRLVGFRLERIPLIGAKGAVDNKIAM